MHCDVTHQVGAVLDGAGSVVEADLDNARMAHADQIAAVAVGSVAPVRVADNAVRDIRGGGQQRHGFAVGGCLDQLALALVGAGGARRPETAFYGCLLDNHFN